MNGFFKQHIISQLYAKTIESKMKEQLGNFQNKQVNLTGLSSDEKDKFTENLTAQVVIEADRKKAFDEKAKSCLFIITLAVTIIVVTVNSMVLNSQTIAARPVEYLLLALAIIYFAASGLTSIAALNIRQYYGTYLDDLFSDSTGRVAPLVKDNSEIISDIYNNTKQNQIVNTIRANYIFATFAGIRNGVILVSVFFITLIVRGVMNGVDMGDKVGKPIEAIISTVNLEWLIGYAPAFSHFLFILGSIGLIVFATKFPLSTRIKDLKNTNERFFFLNGYYVWVGSWLLMIVGNMIQLALVFPP